MTTELFYLTLTALLLASLWIPYIVGVNMLPDEGDPQAAFIRPHDLFKLPAWVHRAHRAHLNLLEQFAPFAALVLIAHALGVSTTVTVWAAAAFFWLRVIHAVGMISGIAKFPVRPIIFVAGYVMILLIGWQVIAGT
ncbi:MAG: MAPEG family protein [Pseudomonadota bacterium]